jgi:tetratricopeptide (TPR) repeat protein
MALRNLACVPISPTSPVPILRKLTHLVSTLAFLARAFLACAFLACALSAPVHAQAPSSSKDDIANSRTAPDPTVLALNRAREARGKGEFNEAMRLVDKAMENAPRDLQLRFMKGLILVDQNRGDEAISVFEGLTQDFPEVGEPHNNLAVLFAGKGDLDKARAALERAILAQPDYALAHENLGDIHLRLAERSYAEANRKNPSSKAAKAKLDQAKEWVKATLK